MKRNIASGASHFALLHSLPCRTSRAPVIAQVKSLEVGTNVVAAYVSGGRAHEVPAVMDALALKASDGFEIAFNQACADVAVGKLDAAEQQLLLAQRLGEYF